MPTRKALVIVLAGGEGKRLMPLTLDRAKPAVPFGGSYRLIDFSLSNMVNSGFSKIVVLTQYKSHSLDRHISRTWQLSQVLDEYIAAVPAQQRRGPHWYLGSADAIYQSMNVIDDEQPKYVVIVGADNVYRMDFSQMLDFHIQQGRPATVAGIRQPTSLAHQFGVIKAEGHVIKEFMEKPKQAEGLPDDPNFVLTSMGNYIFDADSLVEALRKDAKNPHSMHDMGGNIVPYFVQHDECSVYDFKDNRVPGSTPRDENYWRDVGTLDSFYEANMDLISVTPIFNLYNFDWPIATSADRFFPPAKFVHGDPLSRIGHAIDSLVSAGVIISGAEIHRSVISPLVCVHSWAQIFDSVVMRGAQIGRRVRVSRAIIDKNAVLEDDTTVGIDPDYDRARGLTVTDSGITVIPKGFVVKK